MEFGCFSPELRANAPGPLFEAAQRLGFTQMQFDFLSTRGEEMPEEIGLSELDSILACAKAANVEIVAVNGTFNMIDGDAARLDTYIRRFAQIARAAAHLGAKVVTLCTGSRSPEGMWRHDPRTADESNWAPLLRTTEQLLPIAQRHGLILGVEPEPTNVIDSPKKARRYLDEMQSKHLKIIMDCANLFAPGTAQLKLVRPTLQEAFDLLGGDIALAHGKDVCEGPEASFSYPGNGIVDYSMYFSLLAQSGYTGGLILHGIKNEGDFPAAIQNMKVAQSAANAR